MPKPSKPSGTLKPKVIKSQQDYEATMARVEQIFAAKPGTPEGEELELLLLLVEKYEEQAFPIDLPDPIAAIRFRMEQQKLKPKDLVPYIGSKSKVSEVLGGRRELSLSMIRKLVKGLGIPAEVLLREPGAKLPSGELAELAKNLPLAEMLKRGWFRGFVGTLSDLKEQIEEVLALFTAPVGKKGIGPVLNRQRMRNGSVADQHALLAWRIRVVSEALRCPLPRYQPGTVTPEFLAQVVSLSYLEEGPKLAREFLNKSGIHLIVEPHLPRTHLDGAAIRLEDGTPVVALTLRHDRLDNFWFTLLHELAHVSLHLDDPEVEAIFDDLDQTSVEVREQEADSLANEALLPERHWKQADLLRDPSPERVRAFAEKRRIHAAIPSGRIRFETNNYQILGDLIGRGVVRRLFEPVSC